MAKKPAAARAKKQDAVLREDVRKVLERVWPDGTVDMTFDPDESYFNDIQPRLRQAFQQIKDARLIYERAAEGGPIWLQGSDPDEDPPDDIARCRSYHLFFVCPEGEAFTFETEIENLEEPELDEEFEEDSTATRVPGHGWIGWSVAVSLLAPFAVISLNEVSLFDDGSTSEPGIETYAQTEEGDQADLEELYRKGDGEKTFEILHDLRARITGILERHGIVVLPNEEWRKPVSWLRGGDETFVGIGGEPIRVLDAFFFEGL